MPASTIDHQLTQLIVKIERSRLPQTHKNLLYQTMRSVIQAAIIPLVLEHISETELKHLNDPQVPVSLEAYLKMLTQAVTHPQTIEQVNDMIYKILNACEDSLKAQKII